MELIIFIIMILVSVLNAQNKRKGEEQESPFTKSLKFPDNRRKQMADGVRDMEDAVNALKSRMQKKEKQQEEKLYQQQQQERLKKEREERKRREAEEQRKRAIEQRKKQEELRKKQLEKDRKAKEEKAMMERFQNVVPDEKEPAQLSGEIAKDTTFSTDNNAGFCTEEYLDPLTASFYPDVEDYLFPTIASFYPDVDISSFSLQNPQDVV